MKLGGKPLFDPKSDPFSGYRIPGGALALLMVYLAVTQLWRNWVDPVSHDFIAYWGAAKLAIGGQAALAYQPEILHRVQSAVADFGTGKTLPFGYMPAFLVLVLPFGLLPYAPAMVVWVCLTLIFYFVALKQLVPKAGILALAFPPVFVNCIVGQNGFVTSGVFFLAMALIGRWPFIAGLFAGCLVIKPQLAIMLPIAFLAARQWRAIAGAAAASIGITAAGLLALGPNVFAAWLDALPRFARIAREGTVGWIHFTSVYAAGRQAGMAVAPALTLHLLVLAAAAALVWRVWATSCDPLAKASVLTCATVLSSPYLFLYDQVMLIAAFFWLAERRVSAFVLVPLWCLPIFSMVLYRGYTGPVNFGPVVPLILCGLITWQLRRDRSEAAATAPQSLPEPAVTTA